MSGIYFFAEHINPKVQAFKKAAIDRFGQTEPGMAKWAVVIGGDGTMFDFFKATLYRHSLPAFGVKVSPDSRGYLLNRPPSKATNLDWLIHDLEHATASHVRPLRVMGRDVEGKVWEDFAINDIVLSHKKAEQTVDIKVGIDGAYYPYKTRGDGLLVSTYVGSTGYNASAWGIMPSFGEDVMLVTPLVKMFTMQGNLLPVKRLGAIVRAECLAPEWRRVNLSADNRSVAENIAEAMIWQERSIQATLLHAPRLTFERKFKTTRDMIMRKRKAHYAAMMAG